MGESLSCSDKKATVLSGFKLNQISKGIKQAVLASSLGVAVVAQPAVAADTFTEALVGGKASIDLNVRYEAVDQKGVEDASALTERTRVGYKTGKFNGFDAFVEMSGTESIGERNDYHVPAGPDADSNAVAVIADPAVTRLNQAWIGYGVSESNFKLGKQRVTVDPRFLGNVGWRQTEQVFTGFRAQVNELSKVKLDYAYLVEADNLLGVKQPMKTHAVKADVSAFPALKISGYGYFIDMDNSTADSQTLGVRLAGAAPISEGTKLIYKADFASQDDYADANNVGGDYRNLELGVKVSGVTLVAAQEVLGGDGTKSFQTPLATKHAYNGWADKFLATPANGLVDNSFKVATKIAGNKLLGVYHDYSADKGGAHYGSEVNVLLARKFGKNYTAGVKYANYDADKYATDTSKLWVWGTVKF
ncbi:hypothetical protein QCB45_10345 [Thiomicrorhabdus sp. ZW0627]|nr:hypothetical protein [Thiomicrorhabdus sp. ZW0627]